MKKTFVLMIIILTVCLTLAACGCEHQYEEKITTEASCTATGIKTFTCKECKESYTEEIPMIGHVYTSVVTKEPTCAEKGVNTYTCSVCSQGYTEEIEMIPHTLGEISVTKEPTCKDEGEKVANCTMCGISNISEKLKKIDCIYTSSTQKAHTCTEDGLLIWTCSMCGNTKEEITKATGHNWVAVTCTHAKHCVNCNLTEGDALGHDWQDATCTTVKTCKRCYELEGKVLGHDWGQETILKEATFTANGLKMYTCNRCNEQKKEITDFLKTSFTIPNTPIVIQNGGNTVQITSMYYTSERMVSGDLMFDIYLSMEKLEGNGTALFKVKVYDHEGYVVKSTTFGISGAPGDKEKDDWRIWLSPGAYTLEVSKS